MKLCRIGKKRNPLSFKVTADSYLFAGSLITPSNFLGRPLRRSSSKKPKGYWADINNRKKELLEFADTIGFDPYDPNNWANRSAQYAANRVYNLPFFLLPLLTSTLHTQNRVEAYCLRTLVL
jgi:hypothetical protein